MKAISQPAVVKWYLARDVFLGLNGIPAPHYRYGLELARECTADEGCEEAVWLCNVCDAIDSPFIFDEEDSNDDEYRNNPDKDIPRWSLLGYLQRVLDATPLALSNGDNLRVRAFILGMRASVTRKLAHNRDMLADDVRVKECLEQAAQAGYPLSMGQLADLYRDYPQRDLAKACMWAIRGAEAGDPYSMYLVYEYEELGVLVVAGQPCLKYLERAAHLGDHLAENALGKTFSTSDPRYWFWRMRAVEAGISTAPFFSTLQAFVNAYPYFIQTRAIFQIGSGLAGAKRRGQHDTGCPLGYPLDMCTIFNCSVPHDLVCACETVMTFHSRSCRDARSAVDAWTLVAKRLPRVAMNKDIRKLIGEWIWAQRVDWHEWTGTGQ